MEIVLPNGDKPVALPQGWTIAEAPNVLKLVCPEGDLYCSLMVLVSSGTAEEISRDAWRAATSDPEFPILAKGEVPSTHGWDKVSQVVYNVPPAESRNVFTIVRTLGDQAYVALVDGSKAGVSRRLAQVTEILELWKPPGLEEVNLGTRAPVVWGERQSQDLSDFIRRCMNECSVPGLSIAIVQSGEIVLADGFGVQSVDGTERVTSRTRFMIGSSTKPLTTLMMARLIDQGAFTWSTRVTDLLPNFALADPEITSKLEMRHTVCACTGMPRRDAEFIFRFDGVTPEQRVAEMRTMRPTTGFGETFQYSNLLVAVGGYAAASAFQKGADSKTAYENAMRTLVFEPLGMADSLLTRQEATRGDHAQPHALDLEGNSVAIGLTLEGSVESVLPAGGLWSTAEDMARYIMLELNGGVAGTGERLVSEQTLRSRYSGGIKINEKMGYGLGLLYASEQGLHVLSHGGNTFGFTSEMFFLPDQNLGVVLLTNRRVANAMLGAIRQRIFEIVFGAARKSDEMLSAVVSMRKDSVSRTRERIKTDAGSVAWMADYVGSYENPDLGAATVTRSDGGFWIQFESWGSALASEPQADGSRLIVLTSPPWSGSLRFQALPDTGDLIIELGQEKYTFCRKTV